MLSSSSFLERIRAAPASAFLPAVFGSPAPAKTKGRKRARAFDPAPRVGPAPRPDEKFPKLGHVKRDEKRGRWVARWVDKDHVRRHRCYSDAKEGSKEASYAAMKAFVAPLNPPPPPPRPPLASGATGPPLSFGPPPPPQQQQQQQLAASFAENSATLARLHAMLDAAGVPK